MNTILKVHAKYSAMHIGLLSGIHWGLAISNHDLQKDFLNSSLVNRMHFWAGCSGVVGGMYISNTLCYSSMLLSEKLVYLSGYPVLYLGLFTLDALLVK